MQRIEAFAPDGGYISAPSNHLTSDVPVENFFAMYETFARYDEYPIKRRDM